MVSDRFKTLDAALRSEKLEGTWKEDFPEPGRGELYTYVVDNGTPNGHIVYVRRDLMGLYQRPVHRDL